MRIIGKIRRKHFSLSIILLISIYILTIIYYKDQSTLASSTTVKVAKYPVGIASDSSGYIYVANMDSHTVSVINNRTNTVVGNILVGNQPYAIIAVSYNDSRNHIYVANRGANTLSLIENMSVIKSIPVGKSPVSIAYNSGNNFLYVANFDSNNISVVDSKDNKLIGNIAVGKHPIAVAYNSNNGGIYVANRDSNDVSVINGKTNSVVGNILLGKNKNPTGIAYDPNNNGMYVVNSGSSSVSVIDSTKNSIINTVKVGSNPIDVAVNPKMHRIYVTNNSSNSISIINDTTNKVMYDVTIRKPPQRITLGLNNNMIYVTHPLFDEVSLVDDKKNETIKVTFSIQPLKSGSINCKENTILGKESIYYEKGITLKCEAKPKSDFIFKSWSSSNSSSTLLEQSRTINTVSDYLFASWFANETANSIYNPILNNFTPEDRKLTAIFTLPIYVKLIAALAPLGIAIAPTAVIVIWLFRRRKKELHNQRIKSGNNPDSSSVNSTKKRGLRMLLSSLRRLISSTWISSGKLLATLTLVILPLVVVVSHLIYDETNKILDKYAAFIGYLYTVIGLERFALFSILAIFQGLFIVTLFVYPPYPAPYSIEKYFGLRGFTEAVNEYEYVKKILYIAVPVFTILITVPFILSIVDGVFHITSIDLTALSDQPIFRAVQAYSLLVVVAGLFKIIFAIMRKKFRFLFARGCFEIMESKHDEVEKMNYLVKGLNSYNSYLRRRLNLEIKDLKKVYSKIISSSCKAKQETMHKIFEIFKDEKGEKLEDETLETVRYLRQILNVPKTDFLTEQPVANKIKDWVASAAVTIPLAISFIDLYFKFISNSP